MLGQALGPNLISRLSGTFAVINIKKVRLSVYLCGGPRLALGQPNILQNLSSINFSYKISNDQKRKKKRKSEVQKFDNLEDKRIFFGKIKSIFENFLKVLFS